MRHLRFFVQADKSAKHANIKKAVDPVIIRNFQLLGCGFVGCRWLLVFQCWQFSDHLAPSVKNEANTQSAGNGEIVGAQSEIAWVCELD